MAQKFLSEICTYPIKSCKGLQVDQAHVKKKGLDMDRRWMIVDENHRFLSQRVCPKMALIDVELSNTNLKINIPDKDPIMLPISDEGNKLSVSIWKDNCSAIDQGDQIANALSDYLKKLCRLVFMPDAEIRQVNQTYSKNPEDEVSFADGYPFLLISKASLDDLNARLEIPIPMNRFRPNLIIDNCQPYEEDNWKVIKIGHLTFRVVKPCSRCIITTVDQTQGSAGIEPLKTLATYRKREKGIMFGQNIIHETQGLLRVGDLLEVLE